jgi:phage terminase large subunit-like protein
VTREYLHKQACTTVEELKKYCNDVICGAIVACQKHKWACERFLRDLCREGTKEFPWVFNLEKANKFMKWMTFFKHTKGPLAGKHKVPELIEKFIFGNIYGWVHKDTELRRFRKSYWQVGRKNAKSQDESIVGLYEMSGFGEPSSEVYVAATKKDQTRYVWGEARVISEKCEYLKGKVVCKNHDDLGQRVIMHPKSDSFFARMSEEDKKKGDGGNPQCGILDEYHAHPTTEYYDILTSGMKMRKQPLLMIITTAGFELNNPCYREEYRYVSSILDPNNEIENDRYFVMINELETDDEGNIIDDINNETAWLKANPIVAKTPEGLESIRDEAKVAQDKPEKMRDFLTKTLNIWINQRAAGYMNMAKWKKCGATKENPFPDLTSMKGVIGVDLTSKIDLASVGFEFELSDGRVAVLSHSFMPEATYLMRMSKDKKMPWDMWKREKWITVTPGDVIKDEYIIKYIEDQREANKWELKLLGFDLYNATGFAIKMHEDYGYETIEVRQGIPTLHEPTKDLRERAYEGTMIHNNNPVLNWAVGNAVVDKNAQGNMMLDKGKSFDNIDPIAAIIDAHCLVVRKVKPEEKNPYEKRGMRSLL